MKKALTLSIIIPVYNEELVLASCLEAIANQTVKFDEVLVVDNNSTDRSVEIAKSFDFVTVIYESKQGRAHARNAGFEASKCDVIGRINADVQIDKHWVERVIKAFDKDIDALAGSGKSALLPRIEKPQTSMWVSFYYLWMLGIFRTNILWGANMAIRKSAWEKVKTKVINDDRLVHEDQDISLCLLEAGCIIGRDDSVQMQTSEQTYHYFPKLVEYTYKTYKTKLLHKNRPEFKAINRYPPKAILFVLWICPGLIVFPIFFGLSILFWPFDFLTHHFGHSYTS